jgi:hypothetical protein
MNLLRPVGFVCIVACAPLAEMSGPAFAQTQNQTNTARLSRNQTQPAHARLTWNREPILTQPSPERKIFTPEQWEQLRPLFKLVEEVAAGEPAPSDVALTWQSHVLKALANVVLVPFTLEIRAGQFTAFPVAMYLRVVMRGAAAPAPGPRDPLARYPWEDAAVFDELKDGRISRAFVAPAGDYDVYVALGERPDPNGPQPKTVVLKQLVSIPDLTSDLAMSSIIVAEKVEVEPSSRRPTFEEQLDEPYRMWGMKITPAIETTFRQSERLSVVFLVYNTGAVSDKPDVEVQYTFHQKTGAAERFFGRTNPQSFNAQTLRPEFSLAAGDLIIAGQDMPLGRFSQGDYRLEIAVTDKTNDKSVTRDVSFTVAGP